jgi:hypothetical protein
MSEVDDNERVTLADKGDLVNFYTCLKKEEFKEELKTIVSGINGAIAFWHPEGKEEAWAFSSLVEAKDLAYALLKKVRES